MGSLIEQKLEEWKDTVKNLCHQWKANSIHEDVESYFNNIQKCDRGKCLNQDSKAFIEKYRGLGEDIEKGEVGKVVHKDGANKIKFLNTSIDVGDTPEEEVDQHVKHTIFGEFKEEFSKLFDSAKLAVGDFLKGILKSIEDFLEFGFQK